MSELFAGVVTKVCRRCGMEKAAGQYSMAKRSPDGLHAHCRACRSAANSVKNKLKRRQKLDTRLYKRPLFEAVIDGAFMAWRYPVEPGALRWAA